jgi:hypothetical protein
MFRRVAVTSAIIVVTLAMFGCGGRKVRNPAVFANWKTGPLNPGNLNPPKVSGSSLWIGHNNAVQDRKNGHPKSIGTQKVNCGSGGTSCEIEYTWGVPGGFNDQEKLKIRILDNNNNEIGSREHGQSASATQRITIEGCGSVTFEVTVDAGTNGADIASRFEIGVVTAKCE